MRPDRPEPSPDNAFLATHVALLQNSFLRLTGRRLGGTPAELSAEALYHAPFVVLSHDSQPDPVFTYGNLCAQRLFEMDWNALTCLPSRLSAEQPNRAERARLLQQVHSQGYIDHYEGVRISKTGKQFLVQNATVWNLLTLQGELSGQAATFQHWVPLP